MFSRRKNRHDKIHIANSLGNCICLGGTGIHRLSDRIRRKVIDLQRMTGLKQVFRHWPAHITQTDKTDIRHLKSPLTSRLRDFVFITFVTDSCDLKVQFPIHWQRCEIFGHFTRINLPNITMLPFRRMILVNNHGTHPFKQIGLADHAL